MARSYGRVFSSIWQDEDFKTLSSSEVQLLYIALTSQPDLSACGRLTVALGRWADGIAGATRQSVLAGLEELAEKRFIIVDWDYDELLVRTFIKADNGLSNPRRHAAIQNSAQEVSSAALRAALRAENPGVFTAERARTTTASVRPVDNDKTPGYTANDTRTTPERPSIPFKPNQGTVNQEPGAVNQEPQTPPRRLPTHVGGTHGRTTTGPDNRIDTVLGLLADHQIKNAGTRPVDDGKYRGAVINKLLADHGPRIRSFVQDRPDTPPETCAEALKKEIA